MLSLKIEYDVPTDRGLHIQLPPEIQPGKHEIVVVVDNTLDSIALSHDKNQPDVAIPLSQPQEISNCLEELTPLNPAEIFLASGFIGCGEADPLLSENDKSILTDPLREKHGDR